VGLLQEKRLQGELRQSEEMLFHDLHGIGPTAATAGSALGAQQQIQELSRLCESTTRQKLEAEARALELTARIESLLTASDLKVCYSVTPALNQHAMSKSKS